MSERTDIFLTESLGARLDDRGDLDTVTARRETLVQRATLRALNVTVDERGTRIDPTTVEGLRVRVQRALDNDPVIDVPVSVAVESTSKETVTYRVELGDPLQFQLDLPP